ncbi:hypothetical protein F4810DRAFT_715080 [Camillea tinctor]|nr:hypothetical protein F4810DRAFT_715080 [Camillea tinctor]
MLFRAVAVLAIAALGAAHPQEQRSTIWRLLQPVHRPEARPTALPEINHYQRAGGLSHDLCGRYQQLRYQVRKLLPRLQHAAEAYAAALPDHERDALHVDWDCLRGSPEDVRNAYADGGSDLGRLSGRL